MNLTLLLKLAPLFDPIMNKLSHRYRMHNDLVSSLEKVLLVIKDLRQDQPDNAAGDGTWEVKEVKKAQKVLAEAQGF